MCSPPLLQEVEVEAEAQAQAETKRGTNAMGLGPVDSSSRRIAKQSNRRQQHLSGLAGAAMTHARAHTSAHDHMSALWHRPTCSVMLHETSHPAHASLPAPVAPGAQVYAMVRLCQSGAGGSPGALRAVRTSPLDEAPFATSQLKELAPHESCCFRGKLEGGWLESPPVAVPVRYAKYLSARHCS